MPEKENISRSAAKLAVTCLQTIYDDCYEAEAVLHALDAVPAEENTSVVRCRKCQSFNPYPVEGKGWCRALHRITDADWYCADGKTGGI